MGFFDKIRLGTALKAIGQAGKWAHDTIVDGAKNINPLLRMYYDSELGSPIEGHVEKAFAASTCDTLKKFCPNWNWVQNTCDAVGTWIAHKAVQVLDTDKVIYQVSNGRITGDEAYDELAKRATAGLFVAGKVVCRATRVIGKITGKISDFIFADYPEVSEWLKNGVKLGVSSVLRFVRNKVFSEKNKDRVKDFIAVGMREAVSTTKAMIESIDNEIDNIQKKGEKAVKRTVDFISDIATTIGEEPKPFIDKVKDAGKTVRDWTKDKYNKAKTWLKSIFRK